MITYLRPEFDQFGAADRIRLVESPIPVPGRGEVRVRLEAATVQFVDVMIRRGAYPGLGRRPPLVPGYDLVGRVDAVGEGVTASVGERVAALVEVGGNAPYVIVPDKKLVPVPADLDAAQVAGLVVSGVTALQMLRAAAVKKGDRVLVHGGTGAIGRLAIQLAREQGLEVYATARASRADEVRRLGAEPLDYTGDWSSELVAKGGVDAVFDGIGEKGFERSLAALRPGGRLVFLGIADRVRRGLGVSPIEWVSLLLRNLWPGGRRVRLFSVKDSYVAEPATYREDLLALCDRVRAGTLSLAEVERIGVRDVAEAHRRVEQGGLSKRLVVAPEEHAE
jgi:NADPH:quinone reductase-like Zn-dependent oxidoreductase